MYLVYILHNLSSYLDAYMYSQLGTLIEMGWNRLFAILINGAISPPSAMASYPYKLYIIIFCVYFQCTIKHESVQY